MGIDNEFTLLKEKARQGSPNLTLDLSRMTPVADLPRIQSPGGGQSKNDCPLLIFRFPNLRLCLPCWMLPGSESKDRRPGLFDLDHDRCRREHSATMSITPQELQKLLKPNAERAAGIFSR